MWRDSGEVDLRKHLRRATLPPGSGLDAMWKLVSELHSERLDMAAPLWMSCLIDGMADGRFALYIKVHHIVIDGVGGLRMISDSLSEDPGRRSRPPFYADKTGYDKNAARIPDGTRAQAPPATQPVRRGPGHRRRRRSRTGPDPQGGGRRIGQHHRQPGQRRGQGTTGSPAHPFQRRTDRIASPRAAAWPGPGSAPSRRPASPPTTSSPHWSAAPFGTG